jgi:multiple sugar transport system ATP-binding protein
MQAELGVTTIYVTHDQVEAMTMGTRIAVMRLGVLQQQGPPQALYDHPTNLFVATFIGSPGMNLIRGHMIVENGRVACRLGDQDVALPDSVLTARPSLAGYHDRDVALGLRPEHVGVTPHEGHERIWGRVVQSEMLGSEQLLHTAIDAEPVITDAIVEIAADTDPTALGELGGAGEGRVSVISRIDPSFEFQRTDKVELSLNLSRVHLFDLESGSAIG